jgi:Mitochondrial protein Pet127
MLQTLGSRYSSAAVLCRHISSSRLLLVHSKKAATRLDPNSYDSLVAEASSPNQQNAKPATVAEPSSKPNGTVKQITRSKKQKPYFDVKTKNVGLKSVRIKSGRGQTDPKIRHSLNSREGQIKKQLSKIQKLANFAVPARSATKSVKAVFRQKDATVHSLDSSKLAYNSIEVPGQPPVPELAHNLDRTLFNPGVHFLRDSRTNVYNFSPYLENIMSIKDFDFRYIPQYVPSGRDGKLSLIAKQHDKKYTGSTSSLTSILSHFHYLLSQERNPHLLHVSKIFEAKTTDFTFTQRKPASVFLKYNPTTDTHSIDSDNTWDEELIVTILGNSLETLLTTPEAEFELYHKSRSHQLDPGLKSTPSTYNYTACGDFMMRSQLDCYDPRLPGTGMFDLKTRAVCAVRHDLDFAQVNDGTDYVIRKLYGEFESFEREWYELIRSSLLKYSLQARIGRMDGIFVAYHNIRKMFGFQYVPLIEMDKILHTGDLIGKVKDDIDDKMTISGPLIAEAEFKFSITLLGKMLDKILEDHRDRKQDFNIVFFKRAQSASMNVFVKPMSIPDNSVSSKSSEASDIKSSTTKESTAAASTILEDVLTDLNKLPETTTLYQIDNANYINGREVRVGEHPYLMKEDDNWKVETAFTKVTNTEYALKMYKSSFRDYIPKNGYTSSPSTNRLDYEVESARLIEAIKKLRPPTSLQTYLRKLGKKGLLHNQDMKKKFGDKEVQIWFPRPLNLIDQPSKQDN